jgi:CubicO group peptidase (beta-lactamase class C family)
MAAAISTAPMTAAAMADAELQSKLAQRFAGDRTGACVVAAVIQGTQVARASFCANDKARRPIDFDTAFEIGSITKTMTGFLVADLIAQGKWNLNDPIAKHLPAGTRVPQSGGQDITVAHLVTHTSGLPALPSRLKPRKEDDPYAELSAADVLASLADVKISRALGSQFEYSNFGMMVLSHAVTQAYAGSSGDLEGVLKANLFAPLGMQGAFIRKPPAGVKLAIGHVSTGQKAAYWTITPSLTGVGMVRASLNDMVRYAQAQAGLIDTPLSARMQSTHQVPAGIASKQVGINWFFADVKGKQVIMHDGGTGGFSSSLVMDKAAKRAVVVLSDTSMTNLGGLDELSLHLLGADVPLGKPRIAQPMPDAMMQAMVGEFELAGLPVKFFIKEGKLFGQAAGQSAFETAYDSAGSLYTTVADLLITPLKEADGKINRFAFAQGGGVMEAVRASTRAAPTASNPLWVDYAGEYQLAPMFSLRVFEEGGKLKVQGSGQGAIDAVLTAKDRMEVAAVNAVIEFARDASGKVVEATLVQGGRRAPGKKK